MSPAQAILRGYNKDSVFSQQQAFKKEMVLKMMVVLNMDLVET